MSGPANAVVITAIIGVVIARQVRPRRLSGGRWWLLPAVPAVVAVGQGGLVDPHHVGIALVLLTAEMGTGAVIGIAWATTTRVWTADGSVWVQGTRATLGVWTMGIALRAALYGAGAALGVHQNSGSILLAVALTLLIRAGVLVWRAQALAPSYRTVA